MSEELGVNDLAKHMKKSPAVVRGLLRNSKVKRSGKSYSWASKTELAATAKKLGGNGDAPAKKSVAKKKVAAA